ncbi:MAG: RNA polymerase sigma factor [Kiritimatiellae bacterium]|nr:RNA polymerase sigma factor [Kiritimatiellia bacterium]
MSGDDLLLEARKLEQNLLNFFWRQGVSYGEGEDLVQETYIRLWEYRDRYRPTAKLSTFLFMIARQVWIDALRRRTRRESREESWGRERPEAMEPPSPGVMEDMRWAVSRLSEPLREVIELGVFQDLPYAEVAEILSIPVGTVKSRMSNALKKLKEIFDDEGS